MIIKTSCFFLNCRGLILLSTGRYLACNELLLQCSNGDFLFPSVLHLLIQISLSFLPHLFTSLLTPGYLFYS